MELTTLSTLALFETDKVQRQSFVSNVIENLKEGNVDPVKLHLQVKCTEELLKNLKEDEQYRKIVLEEAQKNGKSFERYNSKFSIAETGVKYDYSVCNDPEWNKLNEQMEQVKEKMKEREAFLKNIPTKGVGVLHDDELITTYPPNKTSTTSVNVRLS